MTLSYSILKEVRDCNDHAPRGVGLFVDLLCPHTGTITTALAFCNYIRLEGRDKRYRWAFVTERGRDLLARFDRVTASSGPPQ
jgi:hypothetical protein